MPKRLLLICSETFPGAYKLIKNLKAVLKGIVETDILPIEHLFIFKPDIKIRRIKRRLQKIQADLNLMEVNSVIEYGDNILFAAWGPMYDVVLNKLNKKNINPSLIMCSTPGQSELSKHELKGYHSIIEYLKRGKLKYCLLNKRLFSSIGKIINQSVYFPCTIDLEQFKNVEPKNLNGKNIDLFSTTRLGKNILNQIIAFKINNVAATLHINFSDKLLDPIIKDINANIVHHNWIDEAEYYNLIAGMDLSLQATFTESFCYAVAERMCLGVPVITSYDIYLTASDPYLSKYLCVKSLDSPIEIAKLIEKIIKDKNLRRFLAAKCLDVIERVARKNNEEACNFICSFVK